MIKIIFFIFLIVPLTSWSDFPKYLTEDILKKAYRIDLPEGDKGVIYIHDDHTLVMMPSIANKNFVHNCLATWKFNEKYQTFTIKRASQCELLNGTYDLKVTDGLIYLYEENKTIVFKNFLGL